MSFSFSDTPFRVHIRPDPSIPDAIVLQFECNDGMGVLGLRRVGREDPQPTVHHEETEIEAESLRAGRFVHVLGSGQRQSYALSRIHAEIIRRLPADQWTELRPVTEYGFRYLVVPEELAAKPPQAASVTVAQASASPAPAERPAAVAVAPAQPASVQAAAPAAVRPQPVAKASAASEALPPRQVAMDPALAGAALDRLSKDEAVEHLRQQMAKVEQLHLRVVELEQRLEQSRAREQDLLQVLQRWQKM